jgi:hypothetical protein
VKGERHDKERSMGRTYNGFKRLWRPGEETLEALSEVLSQRWRAAAKLTPTRLFWQAPVRWLKAQPLAMPLEARAYHRTRGGRLIR